MKSYIVYVDGEEVGVIKAASHNAAEKKAQKKYPGRQVMVAYTEFASLAANPAGSGLTAAVLLASAAAAWLFFRSKPAAAATAQTSAPPQPPAKPVPSILPPAGNATPVPNLPPLSCQGKVYVTYKFKDQPAVINVFRRLTTWSQGGTPDFPETTMSDRIWAVPSATDFFNIGVLDAQGWINTTKLENDLKDAQMSGTKRYLAEAWVETSDGWCLAATSTNYELWTG